MLFPELAAALGILLRPLKGDLNREALPSFIAMLLKRGEGAFSVFLSFLAGLRTLFYRRFEASKSATIKLPFEKPSVLHCHAVKAWRGVLVPELAASLREAFRPSAMLLKRLFEHKCFFPSWRLALASFGNRSEILHAFHDSVLQARPARFLCFTRICPDASVD